MEAARGGKGELSGDREDDTNYKLEAVEVGRVMNDLSAQDDISREATNLRSETTIQSKEYDVDLYSGKLAN